MLRIVDVIQIDLEFKKLKSPYTGIYWNFPTQKWRAYYFLNKKKIYVGSFDDPETARVVQLKRVNELGLELYR